MSSTHSILILIKEYFSLLLHNLRMIVVSFTFHFLLSPVIQSLSAFSCLGKWEAGGKVNWIRFKTNRKKKFLTYDRNNCFDLLHAVKVNKAIDSCLGHILIYCLLVFEVATFGLIISIWCLFTSLRLQCGIIWQNILVVKTIFLTKLFYLWL